MYFLWENSGKWKDKLVHNRKLWSFCQQANVTGMHLPIAAAEVGAKTLHTLIYVVGHSVSILSMILNEMCMAYIIHKIYTKYYSLGLLAGNILSQQRSWSHQLS